MKTLHIDIETYSDVSIADCGNYKYAMDPSFRILLAAYAVDDEPTRIIDLASGEQLPEWFVSALRDRQVTKVAHNATFERICFTMWLRREGVLAADEWLDPVQWRCTMVQSARCGLPSSLKQVGEALKLEDQKMTEGRSLIALFCVPHEPRANGLFSSGKRALPQDFPDKWDLFKQYCIRDVDVERAIDKETSWYPVQHFEQRLYAIDQRINDRGVLVDLQMAAQAQKMDAAIKARLNREAITITGLENPNSVSQLKQWIGEQLGVEVDTLRKTDVADLSKSTDNALVKRVLQIRAEMGKTSCAKYSAMISVAGPDGRARGLTQFYGSRTGRWAGRLIQMQNLPQNHLALNELDFARRALKDGDYNTLELCFGNVPDTMSQLIRTAFIAPEGKTFAVCDFSAIECRVLAWLAGEQWVLDVFRKGGDIYCETASQMFHVPVEKHGRNAELRQKGKISVLALGYGGSTGALDAMGGQRLGMTEQEEKDTVKKWREANPKIVKFWREVEKAARNCVIYRNQQFVGSLVFRMEDTTLTIQLPSGRIISYPEMDICFGQDWAYLDQTEAQSAVNVDFIVKEKKSNHKEKYISDGGLQYKGLDQKTNKWCWIRTYGGKLTENITQAVARDCLAEAMTAVEAAGYPVVFHVHDELIMEVDKPDAAQHLGRIQEIFSHNAEWNGGLPLRGAGYTTDYYLKD